MRNRVGCVILAAGASMRFGDGAAKQLLHFAGKPLLQHAIDAAAASSASGCTLVLGAHAQSILDVVDTRRCAVIENSSWQDGLASSIRAGLVGHRDDAACILMVADQPFVTTEDLNALIACSTLEPRAIIALRAGNVWGTPALFPQSDFPALLKLHGDSGAKAYITQHVKRAIFVDARLAHAFSDVDTRADHERLRQYEPRS
jgi:molybdenum cofactor cytidylyltransferase